MEQYRLRVRVGSTEFEAEGHEDIVHRDYEAWKELLDQVPAAVVTEAPAGIDLPRSVTPPPSSIGNGKGESLEVEQLQALFSHDTARGTVSLKYLPQGNDREATAMLLLLLGYSRFSGTNEVAVTQLKTALVQSGLNVERIDRDAAAPLIKEQLVLKGGKAKGGRYKLTNTGMARAEAEARKLLEQI